MMRNLALTLCGLLGMVAWAAAGEEATWREPGQVVDGDYLKRGTLRYTAEGREIVGRNRTCFNNRPLYCPPETDGQPETPESLPLTCWSVSTFGDVDCDYQIDGFCMPRQPPPTVP
jgi:hypothetical protein